ncbi:MAG: hypothetical protein OXR64_13055 [Chloroflexota bacterium]|nr:hypothetical protein [Chloroflexota bacterium]MDE2920757.1 hypothetical protein [Chloroflexota bacterium]
MLDFTRSFITWTTHPRKPHPYYRWDGGFVGDLGDVYRVRMQVDSTMDIVTPSGSSITHYLNYPCRAELTIATEQFFMIPSGEWRAVFTREHGVPIARGPSDVPEPVARRPVLERYADMDFQPVTLPGAERLLDGHAVNEATQSGAVINGQTTYRDKATGLDIRVEFPIRLMNLHPDSGKFQLCCGPVIVPDMATWDGEGVDRVFLAEVALSQFDYVEFILRREIEPAESEKEWFHQVRGRDRLELWDPNNPPPEPLVLQRPRPHVYHETWALESENVILRAI